MCVNAPNIRLLNLRPCSTFCHLRQRTEGGGLVRLPWRFQTCRMLEKDLCLRVFRISLALKISGGGITLLHGQGLIYYFLSEFGYNTFCRVVSCRMILTLFIGRKQASFYPNINITRYLDLARAFNHRGLTSVTSVELNHKNINQPAVF